MNLGFYFDHHVPEAIVTGLRRHGIDCVTCSEDGTPRADDETVLQRATDLHRVAFSQDTDFLEITCRWQRNGRPFYAVVFAKQRRLTVGQIVDDLRLIAEAADEREIQNQLIYLPL